MDDGIKELTAKVSHAVKLAASQPEVWESTITTISNTYDCNAYLAEFSADGDARSRYGGSTAAAQLAGILSKHITEGGRNAFFHLLDEAAVKAVYRLPATEAPDRFPRFFSNNDLDANAGLVCTVSRSDTKVTLFACVAPAVGHRLEFSDFFENTAMDIACSLEFNDLLRGERQVRSILERMISCQNSSAVLIDHEFRIVAQTRGFSDLLHSSGVMVANDHRLIFKDPVLSGIAKQILSSTTLGNHGETLPRNCHVIESEGGRIQRVLMNRIEGVAGARPHILVEVRSTLEVSPNVQRVLQNHFELSQTEARLIHFLSLSGSMSDAQQALGITRNTAKTHMRRIYDKTGVRNQLQLSKLVYQLAGLF